MNSIQPTVQQLGWDLLSEDVTNNPVQASKAALSDDKSFQSYCQPPTADQQRGSTEHGPQLPTSISSILLGIAKRAQASKKKISAIGDYNEK